MKKKVLLLIALLLLPIVFGHEIPEHTEKFVPTARYYPFSPLKLTLYGSISLIVLLILALFCQKRMNEHSKRLLFFAIVIVTIIPTTYLVFTTVYLNIVSATAGPVHWHADYEVWICGQEIDIKDPKPPLNRIGTPLIHDHGDNRIHVEGVLLSLREASLGAFFHAIGGALEANEILVPTNNKAIFKRNGNLCNGTPGKLYVFVNGNLIDDPADYVIAPHETVPPGDTIKIVFTAEPVEQINPYTKQFGRERKI